ncbi:MAG: hypothetical protein IAF94_15205 [Pirellulaceae bacterium]|nr:hypothetical protein [Pirellulaceae bacterium]
MKFSIRDLMFVTVIVALAVGWWVDRRQLREWVDDLGHKVIKLDIENYSLRKKSAPLPSSSALAPKLPKISN